MNYSAIIQTIVLLLLLIISAFFSASETALMSISKIRIRHLMEEEVEGASLVYQLTEKPGRLLSTILVANNAVNIGASALATSLALNFFGSGGVAIATGIMTVLILVFAEITPKSLAAKRAERMSFRIIKPMAVIISLLKPIVTIFNYVSNGIMALLGVKGDRTAPFITEEELKTIVTVSHEEGVLEVDEKQMIYNVFEFGDLHISDVMVQRTDLVAFHIDTPLEEILETVKKEQFSRYPIYEKSIDDIIGILNVKDLILVEDLSSNFNIRNYMRRASFTFEFKKISTLFKEMKKNRTHMCIVLDEYGGTSGIVTIEDLIEEIVGEIQDEYDENEVEVRAISENEYLVAGSTKITQVMELLDISIESDDFDSIGGFMIGQLERFPRLGEVVEYEGISFKVEDIDKNRIKMIRILKK
ncbi:HlyC/CorC family transporter [Alkaliphilus crotonatoxidans]